MERLPPWLRNTKCLADLRNIRIRLRNCGLSTVCEEARCPNISDCFSRNEATFLILGDICTRNCSFCSVHKGRPAQPEGREPASLAATANELGLTHIVITSVTRDDLQDEGAGHFAECTSEVNHRIPEATVEVLTPDFSGRSELLEIVLSSKPDVFGHNVETVGALYRRIRPGASLIRSLKLLETAKTTGKSIVKTGFMAGLGETEKEIVELIHKIRDAGVDILTIGQYIRPSKKQANVVKYWEPEAFTAWAELAKGIGIRYVVAGPFVRSSYRAGEMIKEIRETTGGKKNAVCQD